MEAKTVEEARTPAWKTTLVLLSVIALTAVPSYFVSKPHEGAWAWDWLLHTGLFLLIIFMFLIMILMVFIGDAISAGESPYD